MGSVCVNQCVSPRNPLFCQDCEDPRQLCARAVPLFNMETSTIHLGQGTNTQRWGPPVVSSFPVMWYRCWRSVFQYKMGSITLQMPSAHERYAGVQWKPLGLQGRGWWPLGPSCSGLPTHVRR